MPSLLNTRSALSATCLACRSKPPGSGVQSTFTLEAKHGIGWASIPRAGILFFLHSTTVVPVPQKGSRTTCRELMPNLSRYSRMRCGGNERTKRYQSWTGRSSGSSLLARPFFRGRSNNINVSAFRMASQNRPKPGARKVPSSPVKLLLSHVNNSSTTYGKKPHRNAHGGTVVFHAARGRCWPWGKRRS